MGSHMSRERPLLIISSYLGEGHNFLAPVFEIQRLALKT